MIEGVFVLMALHNTNILTFCALWFYIALVTSPLHLMAQLSTTAQNDIFQQEYLPAETQHEARMVIASRFATAHETALSVRPFVPQGTKDAVELATLIRTCVRNEGFLREVPRMAFDYKNFDSGSHDLTGPELGKIDAQSKELAELADLFVSFYMPPAKEA